MKFIQKSLFALMTLALIFGANEIQAQLHVDAQGEVGIGTTSPTSRLDIRNSGSYRTAYLYNTYSGTSSKWGLYNYVSSAGTGYRYGLYNIIYSNASTPVHYGLMNTNYMYNTSTGYGQRNYAYSYAGNGTKYGLYNYLGCGSGDGTGTRYALYSGVSSSCDGGTRYAGYFSGNVYVSGTITSTSDASKKTNIQELNGALGIVSQLKPKTYDYKMDADIALPTEKQYGFLAQDLEQVLPELVKDVETLSDIGEVKEGEEAHPEVTGTIKTVNYMALIPILTEAIQEQQAAIEQQQAEIEALKAELAKK